MFYQFLCSMLTVLVRVLQRNRTSRRYIFIFVYIKRIITKNWLMQLWRLKSPKICRVSWQARDPGKPVILFQYESECLTTGRTYGVVPFQRLTGS